VENRESQRGRRRHLRGPIDRIEWWRPKM
jgi:hypothetical protein